MSNQNETRGPDGRTEAELADDLALTVINTRRGYEDRRIAGRYSFEQVRNDVHTHVVAASFARFANEGAIAYHRQFGPTFTVRSILMASLQIEEHYRLAAAEDAAHANPAK